MATQISRSPRRLWGRIAKLVTAIAVVAFVSGAGISWWMAGNLAAPAKANLGTPPSDLPIDPFELHSQPGATLRGWHIRRNTKQGVVVLLHAIRGSRLEMVGRARLFHDAGYSVVLIDLQAHGESSGEHITFGYLERYDARAAVDFARQQHPGEPVAVVGRSLGGAAAVFASPLGADALILEAVYSTFDEALENRLQPRLGPLSPLAAIALRLQLKPRLGFSTEELRPIDKIADVGCPVLLFVGSDDRHATEAQTRQLFDRAQEPKRLVVFPDAAHIDLERADPEKYKQEALSFLKKYCNVGD